MSNCLLSGVVTLDGWLHSEMVNCQKARQAQLHSPKPKMAPLRQDTNHMHWTISNITILSAGGWYPRATMVNYVLQLARRNNLYAPLTSAGSWTRLCRTWSCRQSLQSSAESWRHTALASPRSGQTAARCRPEHDESHPALTDTRQTNSCSTTKYADNGIAGF